MNRLLKIAFLFALLPLLIGCTGSATTEESAGEAGLPLQGVKLTLAIHDDQPLADAIEKLAGEWQVQTGSELKVVRLEATSVEELKKTDADALIAASHLLGPLAEAEVIAPLERSMLEADPAKWNETFELPRLAEATWGRTLYGVSFGSPVLVCYYRPDLFEKLGLEPPATWEAYRVAAEMLSDREKLGNLVTVDADQWHATAEPYGGQWAAITLLARAASLAKHRDNYSVLFNSRTMEPLVHFRPIRLALKQMTQAARYATSPDEATDPAAVRRLFWEGRVAMALTWPTATAELPESAEKSSVPMAVTALPGSQEVFNIDEGRWEVREKDQSWQVPLLGIAGRLGVVYKNSKQQTAAARLLLWLSGSSSRPVPASRSHATTLYRTDQIRRAEQWVEPSISPEAADHYAELTHETLQNEQWVFALRIPGRAEYLDALGKAVRSVLADEDSVETALNEASIEWSKITREKGEKEQLRAYRRSLGLEK